LLYLIAAWQHSVDQSPESLQFAEVRLNSVELLQRIIKAACHESTE
jgi:hypothetical protein